MRPPLRDRRQFLNTVAGGAVVSLLPRGVPTPERAMVADEFLLTKGLAYLNTGTIGPCRRATIDAMQHCDRFAITLIRAPLQLSWGVRWHRLQSYPRRIYDGAAASAPS